jgi:hypothetical protein
MGASVNRSYSSACALFRELNSEYEGKIIIPESEIDRVEFDESARLKLLMTILEEILHIRNYFEFVEQYGYIHHNISFQDPCMSYLMQLSYKLVDEFIVGRRKAEIVVKDEIQLFYGLDVADVIDNGIESLRQIISGTIKGEIGYGEAIPQVTNLIIFKIFDVLGRDKSRAVQENHREFNWDYSSSKYFNKLIEPFWNDILSQMELASKSIADLLKAIEEIAKIIFQFMNSLGIELSIADNGECWITFNDSWIKKIVGF